MMWMLGFGGFKLQAFSHLLTAQERIQYFGNICRFQPSHLRFEERCLEETERVAFWDFGILCITLNYMPFFFGISKTKCAIYCAICLNDLSRVFPGFCHVLMSRCWTQYRKHYFPWTCVIPRFLTIYKNTGVTGLWRGHCATGLVIFDAKIYQTRRCCRVCLKHDSVGVLHNFHTYPYVRFSFHLECSTDVCWVKKNHFNKTTGGLPKFFSGHVDADYPKVGDHLHHFW